MRTSGLKSLLSKFEDDEESSVEKDDSSNSQQISQEEADNFITTKAYSLYNRLTKTI